MIIEYQLIQYVKVIEYTSVTIVKETERSEILKRLLHHDALDPDIEFVDSLSLIVDKYSKKNMSDSEAVFKTILKCCDVVTIVNLSSLFLNDLAGINDSSAKQDKERALRSFSKCLSDTRNSFSHAKSNYKPTGNECPEAHISELLKCAKICAQQVIRWYANINEKHRVIA